MSCFKVSFLPSTAVLFAAALSCLAEAKAETPAAVPESEIKELLKGNPYEFEFTVREGQKVVGCPTIISPKSGGYAIDSAVPPPKDVRLPPLHQCNVKVLSRDGEKMRLKVDIKRTVGLQVTDTSATWDSQSHSAIHEVTLGRETSLAIPPHVASGAGPFEVTIAVRTFEGKLSKK